MPRTLGKRWPGRLAWGRIGDAVPDRSSHALGFAAEQARPSTGGRLVPEPVGSHAARLARGTRAEVDYFGHVSSRQHTPAPLAQLVKVIACSSAALVRSLTAKAARCQLSCYFTFTALRPLSDRTRARNCRRPHARSVTLRLLAAPDRAG